MKDHIGLLPFNLGSSLPKNPLISAGLLKNASSNAKRLMNVDKIEQVTLFHKNHQYGCRLLSL